MTSTPDHEVPLTPEQEKLVSRMRRLSQLSALIMVLGAGAVFSVIGYRLFTAPKSTSAYADVTATLPKGARIVSTAVAEQLLVVTVEMNGALEVRTFALDSMKPAGRLRFASEP
ncbi:hypothetical protein [Blastochloris viridis]|uniref:Uncharacterized protein n=1 Tax=Blastochloris viridis TaxID=1079 RepID=A0A0H5BNV3_BLAVI|nr:hypothetical protein [Blastochloris viridis]ALK08433.1 hypothetical protein BVIR_638 [Blastochloris viridis]BAR98288.1 hypothetical protein BV133_695 [Blastochloris viridis]CUU41095.1 hypothetical protein BVIRIDIS_00820 [Blastochloris viridis]